MLGVIVVSWGELTKLSSLPGGTAWSEMNDGSAPLFVKCAAFPQGGCPQPPPGQDYHVQLNQNGFFPLGFKGELSVYPCQVVYGTRPV